MGGGDREYTPTAELKDKIEEDSTTNGCGEERGTGLTQKETFRKEKLEIGEEEGMGWGLPRVEKDNGFGLGMI